MDFLNSVATITLLRLDKYLNKTFNKNLFENLIDTISNIDINEMFEYVNDDIETMSNQKKRYLKILDIFDLQYRNIIGNILDLTIMQNLLPEVKNILMNNNIKITLKLAFNMNGSNFFDLNNITDIFYQMQKIFLVDFNENSIIDIEFFADNRLISYLSNSDIQHNLTRNICDIFYNNTSLHDIIINKDLVQDSINILEDKNTILHILGDTLSGKKFILKHSAKFLNKEILFVNFKILIKYSTSDLYLTMRYLKREALLYDRILCWHNVTQEILDIKDWNVQEFIILCINDFLEQNIQICVCSDNSVNLFGDSKYPVNVISVPQINENDRIDIWKNFCKIYHQNDIDYYHFAIRYKISIGQISEVFKRANDTINIKKSLKEHFEKICSSIGKTSNKLLKLKTSNYTLDDLKLPENQKNTIKEICNNFNNFNYVYYKLNMKDKIAYGRNISALFSGPPGTGKTMTAHVIANTLQIPLLQADISQIFNKYIGETEKNVDAIFTEAEKSNCVLFLDEADALCGKRSEANSSNDKYANNDTAFLLQRIETYSGIILLSTNFINNIDTAFMRRMKYIIQFNMPSQEIRKELWLSSFSKEVPLSSDIDFDYLAQNFEFSGANIKNVVLSAIFLAVEEKTPVNMKHILKSIANEYLKLKKHIMPKEFKQYEELYTEILSENKI